MRRPSRATVREPMIYLASQNLLFVKPHKTASTSVEIALSCAARDPRDIITPLIPEDELLRCRTGGHMPRNWAWVALTEGHYLRDLARFGTTGRIPPRLLPGGRGKLYSKLSARYYNHITPRMIRARGGTDMLARAFVVSMVRHPYEQAVSWAWHQKKLRWPDKSLTEIVDLGLALPSSNLPYLFDDRESDFVIRYEEMTRDLGRLSDRAGIDLNACLPLAKSGHRPDRVPARELLTTGQKERLYRKEAPVFDRFGYAR